MIYVYVVQYTAWDIPECKAIFYTEPCAVGYIHNKVKEDHLDESCYTIERWAVRTCETGE